MSVLSFRTESWIGKLTEPVRRHSEAEAGLMHITGEADGPPVKVGVAVTGQPRVYPAVTPERQLIITFACLQTSPAGCTPSRPSSLPFSRGRQQDKASTSMQTCSILSYRCWPTLEATTSLRARRRPGKGRRIRGEI